MKGVQCTPYPVYSEDFSVSSAGDADFASAELVSGGVKFSVDFSVASLAGEGESAELVDSLVEY